MQRKPDQKSRTLPQGISERHSRLCASPTVGPCDCTPSYRAFVLDRRTHAKVRKTFSGKGAHSTPGRHRCGDRDRGNEQRDYEPHLPKRSAPTTVPQR